MQTNNREYFTELKENLEQQKSANENSYNKISAFRAVSFLAALVCIIIGLKDGKTVFTVAGILFFVLFMILVKIHDRVYREGKLLKAKCEVAKRYVDRFGEEWKNFPEDGSLYMTEDNTLARDIDLLGRASLYQLANVCSLNRSKSRLASVLCIDEKLSVSQISARNEAVKELADKNDFAVSYEAIGKKSSLDKTNPNRSGDDGIDEFALFCSDDRLRKLPAWMQAVRFLFPLVEIAFIVLWLCGFIHYGYALTGFVVILAFTWITTGITANYIMPFYGVSYAIEDYAKLCRCIEGETFATAELSKIKNLISGKGGALDAFAALSMISQAYNIVHNPAVHQILSGLFLWDYHIAALLARWKRTYGDTVSESFAALSDMEVLLSLSTIARVRNCTYPVVTEEKTCFVKASNIRHPLISEDKVVANDADLKGGITIITGSNMSGKTTYERTLAINLVLAYIGAPVMAESFEASLMQIYTSMRITDDVANGISTFYAEILRIKAMVEAKGNGLPMICLIDEIFKGTNSADRIVGARKVIEKLADRDCMTIVSTHDFELCDIRDRYGNDAVNYHFEEYYEGDALKFDYKIKDGRCTTTNAQAILRMAGL